MKKYVFFLFLILLLLIIPISFASDNLTYDDSQPICNDYVQNSIYFNSSSVTDGNGSQETPYKYLSGDRVRDNSTLYFADGEYRLNRSTIFVNNIKIIGQSSSNTIIDGFESKIYSKGFLSISDITLNNLSVESENNLSVSNSIFALNLCSPISSQSNNSIVNIYNSTFRNNTAVYGGVLNVKGNNTKLYIIDSSFINNTAYYGGAVYINGTFSVSFIYGTEFVNNTAVYGGSFYSSYSSVTIISSTFTESKAEYGGAIFEHSSSSLVVEHSDFISNEAEYGGAIFAQNTSYFVVTHSKFISNKAKYDNAAIFTLSNKNEVIQHNVFKDNIPYRSIKSRFHLFSSNKLNSFNYFMPKEIIFNSIFSMEKMVIDKIFDLKHYSLHFDDLMSFKPENIFKDILYCALDKLTISQYNESRFLVDSYLNSDSADLFDFSSLFNVQYDFNSMDVVLTFNENNYCFIFLDMADDNISIDLTVNAINASSIRNMDVFDVEINFKSYSWNSSNSSFFNCRDCFSNPDFLIDLNFEKSNLTNLNAEIRLLQSFNSSFIVSKDSLEISTEIGKVTCNYSNHAFNMQFGRNTYEFYILFP